MDKGSIFVFEGFDGVGKTTIVRELSYKLDNLRIDHTCYSFPGKEVSRLGNLVYDLHHNMKKYMDYKLNSTSLQLLHVACHLDIIEQYIIPDINAGKIVLLDRFWWSTYAYGLANNISKDVLDHILYPEKKKFDNMPLKKIFLLERKGPVLYDDEVDATIRQTYTQIALSDEKRGVAEIVINEKDLINVVEDIALKMLQVI